MKDKLRELAERWKKASSVESGLRECSDALLSILDAEGDGGAVGEEIVDRVAKAISDAVGHGMREKCEHMAHAAISAYRLATWPETHPARSGVVSDEDVRIGVRAYNENVVGIQQRVRQVIESYASRHARQVPDTMEIHADLPPGYRMAERDGDYWPIFKDWYCTNNAFPTRELAALAAWKQAHEKLDRNMDGIRRLAAHPARSGVVSDEEVDAVIDVFHDHKLNSLPYRQCMRAALESYERNRK